MPLSDETKRFFRYSTMFVGVMIIIVGALNLHVYERNKMCDFSEFASEKRGFMLELENILEQNTSFYIELFPDGKFGGNTERGYPTKITWCDFEGIAWQGKIQFPITVTVYIRSDTGEYSENTEGLHLYEEAN